MMFENHPDVIQECVTHRQSTIHHGMTKPLAYSAPHPLRTMLGRFIIRMGESVRGSEMKPRTVVTRQAMQGPSMRRARQA